MVELDEQAVDYTNNRFSSHWVRPQTASFFGHTYTQTDTTKRIILLRIRAQGNKLGKWYILYSLFKMHAGMESVVQGHHLPSCKHQGVLE